MLTVFIFHTMIILARIGFTMAHDSKKRSVVKIITWHITALVLSFSVTYFFTGLVLPSIKITLMGIFLGMVLFYFHERIWDNIEWERVD